ncbi:response regulator [Desulfurivibrio sp. C05AmB]|uniref:response regulator n=1 Tax=Desulfurivibrio sp. C05AmB TaxID=3374371 RepID=UPI00376EE552
MRILLVDDEEELVSALAERLTLRGLQVDWVVSGAAALELAREREYDVAVIDMKMPKISGIELKRKLEAINPELQFIFMSGHGSATIFQDGIDEAGSAGFYLLKPVEIDLLLEKIRTLRQRAGDKEKP